MASPTRDPDSRASWRAAQLPPVRGGGDPWAAFGYLVSGVAVYGAIGFGLGRWLDAPYLTAVGIVVGAALGLYLVIRQFGLGVPPPVPQAPGSTPPPRDAGDRADGHEADASREGRGEPAE